jgi:hypothetical protein
MQYSAPTFDVNLAPEGLVIDLNNLYAARARLKDSRHARGIRYSSVTLLVCIVLAKLAGEDYLAGIAEWVSHRKKLLAEALHRVKPSCWNAPKKPLLTANTNGHSNCWISCSSSIQATRKYGRSKARP